MRWQDLRRSTNVEHRGGGGGGLLLGGGGIGALVIAGIVYLLGGDPSAVLQGQSQGGPGAGPTYEGTQEAAFSESIMGSTEDVWTALFRQSGATYKPSTLTTFRGTTQTACGGGQAAMGPFYCPADQRVYIDLSFFDELRTRFGAAGDFAQAYVIAHEVGHHVQHLTGATRQADALGSRGSTSGSVRLELQADCYAGVWAFHANQQNVAQNGRPLLEPGDVEEGLTAANAIGDDTLQREHQGRVAPDSFTHGSSAQRVRWFRTGLQSGDPASCDTFKARTL
jgi:predicted metalloprotease